MKYRLKDRELQKKLDEISGGDFSVRLNDEGKIDRSIKICFCLMDFDAHFDYEVYPDMLEEVQDYNPKAWNNYPEVDPPEGVLMRVELNDGGRKCALFHHFSDGDSWCHPDGSCLPKFYSDCVTRFRPWDDEE